MLKYLKNKLIRRLHIPTYFFLVTFIGLMIYAGKNTTYEITKEIKSLFINCVIMLVGYYIVTIILDRLNNRVDKTISEQSKD